MGSAGVESRDSGDTGACCCSCHVTGDGETMPFRLTGLDGGISGETGGKYD